MPAHLDNFADWVFFLCYVSSMFEYFLYWLTMYLDPPCYIVPQFVARKHYQVTEVLYILRSVIEKHVEFQVSLCILDGDIIHAHDHVLRRLANVPALIEKDSPTRTSGKKGRSAQEQQNPLSLHLMT